MEQQLLTVVYVPEGDREREGWRIVADLDAIPEEVAEAAGMSRWVEAEPWGYKKATLWATKTYLWGVGRDAIDRKRVEQEAVIMNRTLQGLLRRHRAKEEAYLDGLTAGRMETPYAEPKREWDNELRERLVFRPPGRHDGSTDPP